MMDFLLEIEDRRGITRNTKERYFFGFLSEGQAYAGWMYLHGLGYSLERTASLGIMRNNDDWPCRITLPIILITNKERFR